MSSPKTDAQRRELARRVRATSVEEFHDRLAEAGVSINRDAVDAKRQFELG